MLDPVPDAVFAVVPAPWGPLHVAATDRGVVAVESLTTSETFVARLAVRLDAEIRSTGSGPAAALAATAAEQLTEYLAGGRKIFELPIDIEMRPAWDRSVLHGVRGVPWGFVTSYGRVARRIGRPGAARAVGGAIGRNPLGILIPCHRVVAVDGSLGGYGGEWFGSREASLEIKRELLRLERVQLPAASLLD